MDIYLIKYKNQYMSSCRHNSRDCQTQEECGNKKRTKLILPRNILFFIFILVFSFQLNAETTGSEPGFDETPKVSLLLVFHDFGWNMLRSITYNYGANFLGAGLGTWALIETGVDWKWRNAAYDNAWLANMGLPLLFAGYFVPVITPIPLFLAGRYLSDQKLQITALALVQAFAITQAFHLPFKLITGRTIPGIISGVFFEPNNTRDYRTDDFSGEFKWFKFDFYDGWPSGHTACAFSAAAVIAEIYKEKTLLKIGVYTYAALMGFSVAVNTHWASDSVAGALLGYAVGKAVGKSFSQLLEKNKSSDPVSVYVVPNSIGVIIHI